ncbi:MAG: energy-coupled thiamine transporter ThiT, partial [Lachnospiraceae bacterium]|nr:energy-coupled thiamine transporter ThiT [Lachnospiraceae bacterium]
MSNQVNNVSRAKMIVESAIMIAIASVLSMFKLIDLPYGGSVTIACMLPVIIISYRYGIKWGMLTGLVFSIIQQLLGLNTLSYVTTWQSVLAVVLLDYIIAFMATGLGGAFREKIPSQPKALVLGTILVCVVRYICHVISGATVWAGLSIPTNAALAYSFGYNATYMLPE